MIHNNYNTTQAQQTISFGETDTVASEPAVAEVAATPTQEKAADVPPIYFASLGSGSSGNCSYLGTDEGGILIDAGIDPKKVLECLQKNGISQNKIKGIIITHDHGDHVRYVKTFVKKIFKKSDVLVYCTPKVARGIKTKQGYQLKSDPAHKPIFKEIPFTIGNMRITAFDVAHDAFDNMGFMVEIGDRKFVFSSDLGEIGHRADFYMRQANFLMIESNYDSKLLDSGSYPEYLKNRIRDPKRGHLDNKETAAFVADMYSSALKYVFLCHLSNDNNAPEIALQTTREALEKKGVTVGDGSNAVGERDKNVQLYALPRFTPSLWFVL